MFKKKVTELLYEALEQRPDLFLIDFNISLENKIDITIDGDNGVLVEDCMFVSRAIEHNLDREEVDFALEVASAGATSPLVNFRQFKKNIGRQLEVKTNQTIFEGELTQANKDMVSLKWKAREPKPIGKGKITVQKEASIAYSDIKEAKVIIKF